MVWDWFKKKIKNIEVTKRGAKQDISIMPTYPCPSAKTYIPGTFSSGMFRETWSSKVRKWTKARGRHGLQEMGDRTQSKRPREFLDWWWRIIPGRWRSRRWRVTSPGWSREQRSPAPKEETRTRGYLMCSNKVGGDLQLQIRVWGCTVDRCRENKRKTNKNENKNTINFRENKIWARQEV